MSLIPMADKEFMEKVEAGERDFSRILLYNKKMRGVNVLFPYATRLDYVLGVYSRSDKPEGEYRLILDGADITDCHFRGVKFTDLSAKGTRWGGVERCVFSMPCDLSGSAFFLLENVACEYVDMKKADFRKGLTRGSIFTDCDLRGSNIADAFDDGIVPYVLIASSKLTPEQEAGFKAREAKGYKGIYIIEPKIEPLPEEKKS
jgi:uncharacterized protein YjbI with pentapeptide repeats